MRSDFCGYLSVDPVGLLPSTVQQRPSLVLHVADVDVVAVVFAEGDPRAAEHQEVVAVQNGCRNTATPIFKTHIHVLNTASGAKS